MFMGQSDPDPRIIDLNLYMNFPIEILHQYEDVTQLERLNYGTITITRIRRDKSKVLTEMTSREH